MGLALVALALSAALGLAGDPLAPGPRRATASAGLGQEAEQELASESWGLRSGRGHSTVKRIATRSGIFHLDWLQRAWAALASGAALLRSGGVGALIPSVLFSLLLCWRLASSSQEAGLAVPPEHVLSLPGTPAPGTDSAYSTSAVFLVGAGMGLMLACAACRCTRAGGQRRAAVSAWLPQSPTPQDLHVGMWQTLDGVLTSDMVDSKLSDKSSCVPPDEAGAPQEYVLWTPQVSEFNGAAVPAQAAG